MPRILYLVWLCHPDNAQALLGDDSKRPIPRLKLTKS